MLMASNDPYTYPDSDVLKNRRGIQSPEALQNFEWMRTVRRSLDLPGFPLSARGIQAMHHHLFQDVYEWAGKFRTVNMSKDGEAFLHKDQVAEALTARFQHLRWHNDLKGLSADRFARGAAEHIAELNHIHPFREGNGRVMKLHLEQLAEQAGHTLDLTRIEAGPWNRGSKAALNNDERLLTHAIASMMTPQRTVTVEQAVRESAELRKAAVSEINDKILETQSSIQRGKGSTVTTRSLRDLRDELAVIEGTGRGGLSRVFGIAADAGIESFSVLTGRDGSARDALYALGRGVVRGVELSEDKRAAASLTNTQAATSVINEPEATTRPQSKPSASPGS